VRQRGILSGRLKFDFMGKKKESKKTAKKTYKQGATYLKKGPKKK
jgi:hypothetical protein